MGKLNTLSSKPFFLYLLPIFFVLHSFAAYYFLVPVKEAFTVLIIYLIISQLLMLVFWAMYRNWTKAALVAVFLVSFQLFFGNIHDELRHVTPGGFITKYNVLLPFFFLLFIAWAIYIRRSKSNFSRLASYLNFLLLLIIFIDLGTLFFKATKNRSLLPVSSEKFIFCDTCQQPDVYLIVADEYPGKEELAQVFSFDNSAFEVALKQRGFFVVDSTRSNYNWTPYSMASLLNIDYLKLPTNEVTVPGILDCEDEIRISNVIHFFKQSGYAIYNHSIFPLADQASPLMPVFLSPRKRLITSPTFTERFGKDLSFHFKSADELENIKKGYLFNNIKADSLTKKIAATRPNEKKFVYTHLMLPHHPYYFDSAGKPRPPEALEDDAKLDRQAFISYLLYSNKKLLELIDAIKASSARQPLIVLLSDHGFRQFDKEAKHDYYFMNLNAVLLPGKGASGFYKGMSNVNEFRVLLNTQFGQHLPLLKDSSVFLWEK